MKTRICKKCNKELPLTNEYFSIVGNKKPDWTKYYIFRWSCKKCQVKHTRNRQNNNPDKFHANEKKRQNILKNAKWIYTKKDIENIKSQQKDKCYYCGKKLDEKQQIDHKLPLCKWWTNYPSNLVLACHSCNLDKHSKTAEDFFIRRLENNLEINETSFYKENLL